MVLRKGKIESNRKSEKLFEKMYSFQTQIKEFNFSGRKLVDGSAAPERDTHINFAGVSGSRRANRLRAAGYVDANHATTERNSQREATEETRREKQQKKK